MNTNLTIDAKVRWDFWCFILRFGLLLLVWLGLKNKQYVCFLSHAQIQKLGSVGRLFVVVAKRDFAQKMF